MFEFLLEMIESGFLFFALHINPTNTFPPPLNSKQEQELLLKKENGDEKARQELILHNMRLVAHIIKKYYSACSDQDDLISIGTLGLIKGINTFSSTKGTRLATYAAKCIENAILRQRRYINVKSLCLSCAFYY